MLITNKKNWKDIKIKYHYTEAGQQIEGEISLDLLYVLFAREYTDEMLTPAREGLKDLIDLLKQMVDNNSNAIKELIALSKLKSWQNIEGTNQDIDLSEGN